MRPHEKGFQKHIYRSSYTSPPFGYPRFVDLPNIRRLAAMPYVEMCISTIVDETSSVPWDITVKEGIDPTPEHEKQIEHVKSFYDNPNTNKESFDEIRRRYIRDVLEVDAGVLIKMFNMKFEMVEMMARDGATFTKNPDIFGRIVDRDDVIIDPNIAQTNQEMRLMEPGWISAADAREKAAYFQYGWISGARPVPFGKKEIVWFERNPRTDSIYGRSPIEVLAQSIQTLIYAIEHNLEYFSDNSIPKGIIGLEGADTDALKAFKDQWIEQQRTKDSAGNWKKRFHHVPIVGKAPTFVRLQFTNAELELIESQKWWAKMVWACYPKDIEILTEDGFKLFKDLKEEKVARVNPKNLEIDFVKPIDKQEYDFDGELINYKTKSCDLSVTPEHKMLICNRNKFYEGEVNWEEKQAKDFSEGIIPQAGNFKGENIEKIKFGDLEIKGDDFCKFMGIWLSDGWIESANNRICLCASQVYPENMKFIEDLLQEMDVDWKTKVSKPNAIIQGRKVNVNGIMNYYRFSNSELHDYLIQFGKAKEKFVPKIIRNASKEQRELFLNAFMLGDGSKGYKGKNDRYGSMSKNLLDGLQEMLIKNGKSATLFQNSYNDCWELTVRKTKSEKIENKYYSRIVKENVSKEKYKGKVYDVTVPENHFLVVRRNGRVSISGNCFGVTATELGYTEDAKGLANQIVQSNIFRKRAINPILRLEEYKHNHEIISEFEYPDIEFKFLMFDVEEETKKAGLYKIQLDAGYKTVNEIRREEGMEDVEDGDEIGKKKNEFWNGNPFEQEQQRKEEESEDQFKKDEKKKIDEKAIETKPFAGYRNFADCVKKNQDKKDPEAYCASIKRKVEGKGYEDNPLILREFEEITEDRLIKSIVYLMKENEKKIKDLIEKEIGKDKLMDIKSVDDIAKRIKDLISFMGLKTISDAVIKNTFVEGWDDAEMQLDKNLMMNKDAITFIQDYTFNNIKGMTEEITQDLRQELERGIMAGEGITKIKARVSKVFDVGEVRAAAIARTEVNRSENQGRLLAWKSSGETDYMKKWMTHFDAKTSAICKRLDGQIVGINENFKEKTSGWEGPTSPAHVNCRSTVIYIHKEDIKE